MLLQRDSKTRLTKSSLQPSLPSDVHSRRKKFCVLVDLGTLSHWRLQRYLYYYLCLYETRFVSLVTKIPFLGGHLDCGYRLFFRLHTSLAFRSRHGVAKEASWCTGRSIEARAKGLVQYSEYLDHRPRIKNIVSQVEADQVRTCLRR